MSQKLNSNIRLAIAIPTYNEAKNIGKLVKKIKAETSKLKIDCTILIIDDNSPDGTGKIADGLAKSENNKKFHINVLHRKKKDGLNKAYIEGFDKLLTENFSHILQMDADLSHDLKYLPLFIKSISKADFVVGSRYIHGGATPDWAWSRKLLSRGGNLYTRLFLGSTIADYTGGYNLYSTDLMKKINIDSIKSGGYGFLIELKFRAVKNAENVVQIPIVFKDRVHGESKIPKSTLLDNFILVLKIRFMDNPKA